MIIPLIAAGLAIAALAGWLVLTIGDLDDTKGTLASAKSRITKLDKKVSALSSQIESLEDEKRDLETQNSSLSAAMTDCKDAAGKIRTFLRAAAREFLGTGSVEESRTAWQEANQAWFVCRAAAASNGAI